jgi:hypothetical protein
MLHTITVVDTGSNLAGIRCCSMYKFGIGWDGRSLFTYTSQVTWPTYGPVGVVREISRCLVLRYTKSQSCHPSCSVHAIATMTHH